jgi:hypothetical protein
MRRSSLAVKRSAPLLKLDPTPLDAHGRVQGMKERDDRQRGLLDEPQSGEEAPQGEVVRDPEGGSFRVFRFNQMEDALVAYTKMLLSNGGSC